MGFLLFHKEYEGNYSPSAGQLDGGWQCPYTAQSVQMSSAQLTSRVFTKSLHGFHSGLPIENTCKSYYGDVTLIIPVNPAYAAATSPELFLQCSQRIV